MCTIRNRFGKDVALMQRTGVHLLDRLEGSSLALESKGMTFWAERWPITNPVIDRCEKSQSRPNEGHYVVAAHGHLNLSKEDAHRSSPITYDEISATEADYVALGHWHVPTDASHGGVTAWYPGASHGLPWSRNSGPGHLLKTKQKLNTCPFLDPSVVATNCYSISASFRAIRLNVVSYFSIN